MLIKFMLLTALIVLIGVMISAFVFYKVGYNHAVANYEPFGVIAIDISDPENPEYVVGFHENGASELPFRKEVVMQVIVNK